MLALQRYDFNSLSQLGYFVNAKLIWMSVPIMAFVAVALLNKGHFSSVYKGLDFQFFLT